MLPGDGVGYDTRVRAVPDFCMHDMVTTRALFGVETNSTRVALASIPPKDRQLAQFPHDREIYLEAFATAVWVFPRDIAGWRETRGGAYAS